MTESGQAQPPVTGAVLPRAVLPRSPARLDEIDAMRGLALGGMLLVNLRAFSGADLAPVLYQSGADWLASVLAVLLAQGKFYPLFAFLFGWGIARRQEVGENLAAGKYSFFRSNLRRMAVLAVIGLLHATLLWPGDVLFVYALIGMLLPLLRSMPSRMLAGLGIILLLLAPFLLMPGPGTYLRATYGDAANPLLAAWLGLPGRSPVAGASLVQHHAAQFAWKLAYFPDWLGSFAALILTGYACGRDRALFRPSLRWIFLLALPLNLFYALTGANPYALPAEWSGFLRSLAISLGGPLLALGYALAAIRLYQTDRGRAALEPLRKIGRMPLTTYLAQSVIGAALFSGMGRSSIAPAWVWPLAGAIFVTQVIFAGIWLKWFRQGPVEWLWRRLGAGLP